MKANMGFADKIVRILAAIVIGVLYFTGTITGTISIILLVVAAIFLATSLIGICPLYIPFGQSTLKKKTSTKI
jgi:hypothetical protein